MKFWKLDGAGNDFVLIEAAKASALAKKICDRRRGVGADGLLIVNRSAKSFRYFNADGSETFCGNGARCAAVWLHQVAKAPRFFDLTSSAGTQTARIVKPGVAALTMPRPRLLRAPFKLGKYNVSFWDTGVPHAVVPVKNLADVDVAREGRALRHHKAFGKQGANVDFIQKESRAVAVRTYERGVEAETLACGTGIVAAALAAETLGWTKFPVLVSPASGAALKVYRSAGETYLEGPARVVFQGEFRP